MCPLFRWPRPILCSVPNKHFQACVQVPVDRVPPASRRCAAVCRRCAVRRRCVASRRCAVFRRCAAAVWLRYRCAALGCAPPRCRRSAWTSTSVSMTHRPSSRPSNPRHPLSPVAGVRATPKSPTTERVNPNEWKVFFVWFCSLNHGLVFGLILCFLFLWIIIVRM